MDQSDAEVVERARGGDRIAIGELFSRYWRAARAAAFGVTGEVASAEDAAADAFREAWAGFYFEGYDSDDAARFLAIPPGTFRRRLHEGRRLLRYAADRVLKGTKPMKALDFSEAATRFFTATGDHRARLQALLPPGFADGQPGAFVRGTRALLIADANGSVRTTYRLLQDSADQQTFQAGMRGGAFQRRARLDVDGVRPTRIAIGSGVAGAVERRGITRNVDSIHQLWRAAVPVSVAAAACRPLRPGGGRGRTRRMARAAARRRGGPSARLPGAIGDRSIRRDGPAG